MQVAAFDTAFFAQLPRVAREYALPAGLGSDQGVRRYGFHGLAHEAMLRRRERLHPELPGGGRLITLQLGGGCSIAALSAGRPVDTSMGFSPLEGLVMATRSGDIDAAVVPYLQQRLGISAEEVIEQLNREAGLDRAVGRQRRSERTAWPARTPGRIGTGSLLLPRAQIHWQLSGRSGRMRRHRLRGRCRGARTGGPRADSRGHAMGRDRARQHRQRGLRGEEAGSRRAHSRVTVHVIPAMRSHAPAPPQWRASHA